MFRECLAGGVCPFIIQDSNRSRYIASLKKAQTEDDFLDLEKLHGDYKKILMEFELGYSEKGYLDMCRHCNGADAKDLTIPVAEQVSV